VADDQSNICRVCRREHAKLSFEHVPPRAAFNNEATTVYGLDDWLHRDEDGKLSGGRIAQRGAGDETLCEDCNNKTASWYGTELKRAANSGARILRESPLDELDASLEYRWADIDFRQSETGPHPLRLIKQIVTMLLATSPIGFSMANPDLGDFVLDRERTGLPERFQFYLGLFAGPHARSTGFAAVLGVERNRVDGLVEVAFPPLAYVMTVDSPDDTAIPTSNITAFVNIGYNQRADVNVELLIGFGHTPWPADYRTTAMIERDRTLNEGEARGDVT
jgi:hypothetical protein